MRFGRRRSGRTSQQLKRPSRAQDRANVRDISDLIPICAERVDAKSTTESHATRTRDSSPSRVPPKLHPLTSAIPAAAAQILLPRTFCRRACATASSLDVCGSSRYLRSPVKQLKFLKNENKSYGGELLKTRKGRSTPRPLSTRETMHLVLRSSKAKGDWSFRTPKNAVAIGRILKKFSQKYGVQILNSANVGNHLHLHVKLAHRHGYRPFIRAVSAAIMMTVTGVNRWMMLKPRPGIRFKFWDYRPFSRVVVGLKSFLGLRDYVRINELEGLGVKREYAEVIVRRGLQRRRAEKRFVGRRSP
jgi:REP element-mobilizing transposase RayT